MPRKDRPVGEHKIVTALFFLKFTSKATGETTHYGPFDSSIILERYYDQYGEYLKTHGDLDSVAIHHSKVKNIPRLLGPDTWIMGLHSRMKVEPNV